MSDTVQNLIRELGEKGWSGTHTNSKLIFTRDGVIITGYQEHVTAQLGDFQVTKASNRYWTTMERLEFLVASIRKFANLADTKKLEEMARWDLVQKSIESASWEQVMKFPDALFLFEKAVALLQ